MKISKRAHAAAVPVAAGLAVVVITMCLEACGSVVPALPAAPASTAATVAPAAAVAPASTVAPVAPAASTVAPVAPASTPTPVAPASAAPPASTASAAATGTLGSTLKATDADGNAYTVTLVKVVDPATGSDEFNQPDSGKYLFGAVFTIAGETGNASDDANNDAVVVGSDDQDYTADFDSIAGYTNFQDGDWSVSPGTTVTGAVTFQLPNGVTVKSVQWSADLFGGTSGTWNL